MFRGSMVALVTPFKRDGSVDFRRLSSLVEWQISCGTDALVPCGTTGEGATLSAPERAAVIRAVVRQARSRIPVIAGAGSNSTAVTVLNCREAKRAGADALLVVTPYYNKPTQAGLFAHYERIAREVPLPVVLYNVPSRTGVTLAPETVARLSRVPGIAAIKEAGGSLPAVSRIMALCDLPVLSGDDALTVPMMAIGARGLISVMANVAPAETKAMVQAASMGDWVRARELHHRLHPLMEACFLESNPIPVKAMLALRGRIGPAIREPLGPPSKETMKKLKAVLGKYTA